MNGSLQTKLQRAPHLIASVIAFVGLLFYAGIAGIQLYDQVFWTHYFDNTVPLGEQCDIAIWNDPSITRAKIMAMPPESLSYSRVHMPHRGRPGAPKVAKDQTLHTRCQVDFTNIPSQGFAWIYLGRSFGKTVVYINGEEVASSSKSNGETFEFPIPPGARGKISQLELVSHGTEDGSSGLATLIPAFATDDVAKMQSIRRYLSASDSEQQLSHFVASFILLAFFFGIWIYGMKYRDLFWIIVLSGTLCILHGLRYYRQFDSIWISNVLRRTSSALYFIQIFAQVMFLAAFTRVRALYRRALTVFAPTTAIFVVLAFMLSQKTFLDWKMLVRLPTIFGQVLLWSLIVTLALLITHSQSPLLISRARKAIYLALFVTLILLTQSILDHTYGIYIDTIAQTVALGSFAGIMLWDLLRRQSEYFSERSERLAKEQQLREADAVNRTVKYLAHDLLKPFNLLNLFSEGLVNVKSADLKQYCQQFQLSLSHAKNNAQGLMQELLLSSGQTSDVVKKSTDLETELTAVHKMFEPILNAEHIGFSRYLSVERPVYLAIDPLTFRRLLSNIFDNAIKAMQASGKSGSEIRIDVSANSDRTSIRIYNSNSFIPSDRLDTIFVLGERMESHGRFGLGLAFVHSTLEDVGGKITCDSDSLGTTFTIDIPLSKVAPVAPIVPPRGVTATICVVDDDEFILLQWKQYAKTHPEEYHVDTFTNPADLLARCQEFPDYLSGIALILMDEIFSDRNERGSVYALKLKKFDHCPEIATTSTFMKSQTLFRYVDKQPKRFSELLN